jgi:hypothetical protein
MAGENLGEVLPEAPAAASADAEAVEVSETQGADSTGGTAEDAEAAGESQDDADDDAGQEESLKLPEKAQKAVNARIGKLTARAKTAEEKLAEAARERDELRQRVERVSDGAILKAAEQAGVLPELLDKETATMISDWRTAKDQTNTLEAWLEDHSDPDDTMTLDAGGQQREYKRSEVAALKRQWKARMEATGEEAPARIREARQKTREVLALGLAALKAGWKPGAKAPAAATGATSGKPALPAAPVKASVAAGDATPRKGVAKPKAKGEIGPIRSVDDLAAAMENGLQ